MYLVSRCGSKTLRFLVSTLLQTSLLKKATIVIMLNCSTEAQCPTISTRVAPISTSSSGRSEVSSLEFLLEMMHPLSHPGGQMGQKDGGSPGEEDIALTDITPTTPTLMWEGRDSSFLASRMASSSPWLPHHSNPSGPRYGTSATNRPHYLIDLIALIGHALELVEDFEDQQRALEQ